MSSAMLFGTGFPGNVFNEFRTASCSELIDRYSSKVSIFAQTSSKAQGDESTEEKEPVEDRKPNPRGSFLLAYCNLISHQSPEVCDLRRTDFLRSAEVLPNMGKRVSFLDKENYEYWKDAVSVGDFDLLAAAVSFLDVHKALNELNFSSVFDDILFGLDKARESGCAVFEVFFLVLRASLERYWGLDDDAAESFEQANMAVPLNEDGKFCLDLVNLVSTGVDNDNAAPLARYYLHELARLQDLQRSCNTKSESPDFYASIFGATSFKSAMDSLSDYPENSVKWNSQYAQLTPNQRLCYDISQGRSISIDGINIDSFILAPEQIAQQFSLSKESKTTFRSLTLFTCFDFFLKNTRSFVDLRVFKPLLLDWFKGGPDKDFDNFRTSGVAKGMLDAIIRLTCTRGSLQSRCRNLLFLLAFAREDLRRPELRDPNLAIALYRSIKCNDDIRKDFVMDVLEPICSRFSDADPQKVQKYEEILRQGTGELDINSLFSNDSISSVLLNIYGSKPFETVELLEKFGENNVLEFLCRRDLETLDALLDISSHNEKEDTGEASEPVESESGEKSLIRNMEQLDRYIWRLKDSVPERFIFIFNKPGHWDVEQYQERQAWYCVQTEETVYPVKLIEDWKSRNPNYKDAKVVIMLMSGVKLVRTRILPRLQNGCVSFFSLEKFKSAVDSGGSADNKTVTINDLLEYVDFSDEKNIPLYLCFAEKQHSAVWDLHRLYSEAMKCGCPMDRYSYRIDKPNSSSIFYNFGLSSLVRDYALNLEGAVTISYTAQFRIVPYRFVLECEKKIDGYFEILSVTFTDNRKYSEGQFDMTGICDDVVVHRLVINGEYRNADDSFKVLLMNNVDNIREWRKPDTLLYVISIAQKSLLDKIAKNAIMTRNISHNLGSHVMAYLKYHLVNMESMLGNSVFDNLFRDKNDYEAFLKNPTEWWSQKKSQIWKNRQVTTDKYDWPLPFLKGLGRFISYIQERQDFIATIATDFLPSCVGLNFKDYIYDELNLDKRALRHPERQDYEIPDNILLGNIARSEGLYREHYEPDANIPKPQTSHDIVLKFRSFDGNSPQTNEQFEDLEALRRYNINIPGGSTGRHAFFSIMENVIRNAAKHGKRKTVDDNFSLELTLDIYDVSEFDTMAPEADNIVEDELSLRAVFSTFYKNCPDGGEYYYVTLTDNQFTDYETLVKIRKALIAPYTKDGQFCDTYKGFKEMRICSNYLINNGAKESFAQPLKAEGEALTDSDGIFPHDGKWKGLEEKFGSDESKSYHTSVPTLYARLTKQSCRRGSPNNNASYLQFIFPVRRQMEVLIVSDKVSKYKNLNEELKKFNWSAVTVSQYKGNRMVANYKFVLLDDESGKLYSELRPLSNYRLVIAQKIGINLFPATEDSIANSWVQDFLKSLDLDPCRFLEETTNKILLSYSNYSEGDVITILDHRTNYDATKEMECHINGKMRKIKDLVRLLEDPLPQEILNYKYVYLTHYESEPNFNRYKSAMLSLANGNEAKQKLLRKTSKYFIEGISGSNSTDRLIRREKIDLGWFCRHLQAIKMKVGIFDERLADNFLKIESISAEPLCSVDYKGVLYADKNIWIFNILENEQGGFVIIGVSMLKSTIIDNGRRITECCRVANISKGADGRICVSNPLYSDFDRLSIHQGLLDKIYDKFGIRDDNAKKEEFTKSFYEAFCPQQSASVIEMKSDGNESHYFLPGFSIHSGRSKPSENDMPQKVPFIQFSLLEHAVLDSKYELAELLNSAKYE